MAQQKPVICQHCREKFVRVEGKFEKTGFLYYRTQDIGLMEMEKKTIHIGGV